MEGSILRYLAFVNTVDCGSFTKAAAAMGYTQSSISKMIAELEEEWGLILLRRSRAGVRLTSDGSRMLPFARAAVESFRKAADEAARLRDVTAGVIRMGIISSAATQWLPEIIRRFQKDYPLVDFELIMGGYHDIEQWIFEGRVECGILRLPAAKDLDTIYMGQDELVAVLPQGHELASKELIAPEELNGQPFLLLTHAEKVDVSDFLEKYGISPRIRFTSWDDYSILAMAESGFGIAMLPELITKRIPYDVVIRKLTVHPGRMLGFAMKDRNTVSAAVKRFIQYLECGQERNEEPSR